VLGSRIEASSQGLAARLSAPVEYGKTDDFVRFPEREDAEWTRQEKELIHHRPLTMAPAIWRSRVPTIANWFIWPS